MKKLLSCLCVLVLIFSLFSVSSADIKERLYGMWVYEDADSYILYAITPDYICCLKFTNGKYYKNDFFTKIYEDGNDRDTFYLLKEDDGQLYKAVLGEYDKTMKIVSTDSDINLSNRVFEKKN